MEGESAQTGPKNREQSTEIGDKSTASSGESTASGGELMPRKERTKRASLGRSVIVARTDRRLDSSVFSFQLAIQMENGRGDSPRVNGEAGSVPAVLVPVSGVVLSVVRDKNLLAFAIQPRQTDGQAGDRRSILPLVSWMSTAGLQSASREFGGQITDGRLDVVCWPPIVRWIVVVVGRLSRRRWMICGLLLSPLMVDASN